jgi:hypothetical protein
MNIDDNVNSIVQGIITEITSKVELQVAAAVEQKIAEIINNLDTSSVLADQLGRKLDARIGQLPIDTKSIEAQLLTRINTIAADLSATVQNRAISIANETIAQQVNKVDFNQLTQSSLVAAIQNRQFTYPTGSIPATAIDFTDYTLSGDKVVGGIITQFGSTGIDDKATACQLSIFDETTVVENNLLTRDLTVKGTVNIEGDLNVTGQVDPTSPFYNNIIAAAVDGVKAGLDQSLFTSYSNTIFEKIQNTGLDLNRITMNGQEVISAGNLAPSITSSNLQKLGQLRELQVQGEALLSGTLYTTTQRVGINTIEPGNALSVWDQEVEIGFGKKNANTGFVGTPRNQSIVLSSNGQLNLTATPDGAVQVNELHIGAVKIISAMAPPNDVQPIGCIVFNANPTLGGPMGWVSLGGARWANFGIID